MKIEAMYPIQDRTTIRAIAWPISGPAGDAYEATGRNATALMCAGRNQIGLNMGEDGSATVFVSRYLSDTPPGEDEETPTREVAVVHIRADGTVWVEEGSNG
jgi:hypothetical protein